MQTSEQLQEKFLELIDEMVSAKCPLPEFNLYYKVESFADREGTTFTIKPFLTEDEAQAHCKDDVKSMHGSKYWHTIKYSVVPSSSEYGVSDPEISMRFKP